MSERLTDVDPEVALAAIEDRIAAAVKAGILSENTHALIDHAFGQPMIKIRLYKAPMEKFEEAPFWHPCYDWIKDFTPFLEEWSTNVKTQFHSDATRPRDSIGGFILYL